MRLKQHWLIRPFALTATAAMFAMVVALAFGAGVSFAKTETSAANYYEDSLNNLCVGVPTAGLFAGSCEWQGMTGEGNVGIGAVVLKSDTTGNGNVASGFRALEFNTTGGANVASGVSALLSNTTGSLNTASGAVALFSNTSGERNVASGFGALFENTTGSFNVALGQESGVNLTSGSNNIDISNAGVSGEEGTTRIGSEGKQTKAFMAGVYGNTLAGTVCTVGVKSDGQLGCTTAEGKEGKEGKEGPVGPAGNAAIATFASFEGVPSGRCLNYTEIAPSGNGKCPGSTTGFSNSNQLAGPTPEGGAKPSDLYADTNATIKGSAETVLVAVIDNTTGATLISCKVNSTTVNHCSTASGSDSAAAGDNIEVKVTATPSNGNGSTGSWRVRFRY